MARPETEKAIGADAIIGFRLPASLRVKLERIAKRDGIVLAEAVRRSVADYVLRHEKCKDVRP